MSGDATFDPTIPANAPAVIRGFGLLQSELLHTTSRVWVNYLSSVFGEFWLVSDNKRDKKLCTSCLKIMA